MPIPSGYFCHTSCAIGKGRQPQQHDCPLFFSFSLSPSVGVAVLSYPNFTPENQYLLITLEGIVLCTFSFRALYISVLVKTLKKKKQTSSFRGIAKALAAVLCDYSPFSREGGFRPILRHENSPYDSLFLRAHLPCHMGMSTGTGKNSTKLGSGMGNIPSSWLEFK